MAKKRRTHLDQSGPNTGSSPQNAVSARAGQYGQVRTPLRPLSRRDSQEMASRLHVLLVAVLLVGTIFAAYLPAIHGGFIWDDEAHVTRPELRSLYGLWRIWFDLGATQQYYPLLHSAFWVEHKLWGDAPVGYHLVNILLHALAACLLLLILRRLKIPGAYLAAAIFALHPVYVESVAWITEQKNTLSVVFYLGAMLAYLRFDQERRTPLYLLALGLFVLGLLTKTVTATLPGALLVIFWWQRRRLSWQRDVLPLIPWFVLGAAAGLFTAWVEHKLIGAEGEEFALSLVERCLLAGRVIWFYLGKLFWPVNLIFIYPRWEVNPAVWWQYLFPLAVVALVVMLWLIRHWWRGPLAGLLFFIGSLFPVLGFFNVYPFIYSFVADHFQYLASLGIIVLVSAGIAVALARVPLRARWAGQALCVVLLGTLAVLTWQQSRMYSDIQMLYRTTLERNPRCWMCLNNLGLLLDNMGRVQEAIEHYKEVLRIKPNYAAAHLNWGIALAQTGRVQEAIEHYKEALRIKPNYTEVHNNLGVALLPVGRVPEAIRHFEQALRIRPNFAEAHYNWGIALAQTGRVQEAIEHFKEALRLKPDYAEAHNDMGIALAQTGRVQEAIEHYKEALRIKPNYTEAHYNWGITLAQTGRVQEAIEHYKEALRIKPNYTEAHNNLGIALAQTGRVQEAIEHLKEALRISPNFAQARNNLSLLLARQQKAETRN